MNKLIQQLTEQIKMFQNYCIFINVHLFTLSSVNSVSIVTLRIILNVRPFTYVINLPIISAFTKSEKFEIALLEARQT